VRVLVARSPRQAAATVELLEARGAVPVVFPLIDVEAHVDPHALGLVLGALAAGRYDVVAFTSGNGVAFFEEALTASGVSLGGLLANVKVAAVGPSTRAELERRGVSVSVDAERFVAEELAHAIVSLVPTPRHVLFPRALEGREALPEGLRAAGVAVDVLPVYRTLEASAEGRTSLVRALASTDAVLLTSASTARALATVLGSDALSVLSRVVLASIGPVTTEAARACGLAIAVTATESTVSSLIAALERHVANTRG
jgi:uroporphyrinogen III methyltransferase/synthase